MSQNLLVSVLIPAYNAGEYLKESVLSIVNQTYTNLEIIIIDDGSTDGCIDSISGIKDSRIKIMHQKNKGKAAALNKAWDELAGEFFIIQDADDKSYPQRVEMQLDRMACNPELAAVFVGNDIIINNKQFAPLCRGIDVRKCRDGIEKFMIPAHDATGMYRISSLGDMRFDESLRIGQGVDFVLRVGEKFPMMRIGACLYSYRVNYQSTIHKSPQKTINSENVVRKKAYQRRGLEYDKRKKPIRVNSSLFMRRNMAVIIIPHCMASVLELKQKNKIRDAVSVGWQLLILNPINYYHYKPLAYAIAPLKLVKWYRKMKTSIIVTSV